MLGMEEGQVYELMRSMLCGEYVPRGHDAPGAAPEGRTELDTQLLLISDRIKLIERQLTELGHKKEQLVRQMERLAGEEHQLQEQLIQETNKQSLLTQRVLEMDGRKEEVAMDECKDNLMMEEMKEEVVEPAVKQGSGGLGADSEDSCSTEILVEDKMQAKTELVRSSFVAELAACSKKKPAARRRPASCRRLSARSRKRAGKRAEKNCVNSEVVAIAVATLKNAETVVEEERTVMKPMKTETDTFALKCRKCGKEFKRSYHLTRHSGHCVGAADEGISGRESHKGVEHRAPPSFDCGDCGRTFRQLHTLKHHQQAHIGLKPHQCAQCNKRFTTKYALKLHGRLHAGDFRHLCSVCGKGFVDVASLKKHMENHVREYGCDVCGKYFSRRTELKIHQRRHTGERPYMCAVCGRSYPTSSELRYHLPMHNDVKEHVCGVCQRAFHHSQAYRDHIRTHTGETPFACLLCPLRFTSKYRLVKHQLVAHSTDCSEVPRLTCAICAKAFCTLGNLKIHQRSHSSDKPHQCQLCDKQYKNVYDLVLHCRKKHGSTPGSQGE